MTKQHEGRTEYSVRYARFGSELAAELRREVYGTDSGQMNWRTAAEQAEIAEFLRLGQTSHVLDVACGSGGPSLALIEGTRCRLTGVDLENERIAYAQSEASARGLADQATFAVLDCGAPLPFGDSSFDAVLCIDAIVHVLDRFGTLRDWARLLRKRGTCRIHRCGCHYRCGKQERARFPQRDWIRSTRPSRRQRRGD